MLRAPIIPPEIDWRARLFLEVWSIIGLKKRRNYFKSLKTILDTMIFIDIYPNYLVDIDQIFQNWVNSFCVDSSKNLVKLKLTWRDYINKKGVLIPSHNKQILLETTLGLYLEHASKKILQTGWATGHKVEIINNYIETLKDLEVLVTDSMIDPLKYCIAKQRKSFWDSIKITNLDIEDFKL